MEQLIPDNLTFTEVGHLPIVKQFAKQINLVDTINTMVKSQMQLPPFSTLPSSLIPYAMSDINSGIATVEVKKLLNCMRAVAWCH